MYTLVNSTSSLNNNYLNSDGVKLEVVECIRDSRRRREAAGSARVRLDGSNLGPYRNTSVIKKAFNICVEQKTILEGQHYSY